MGFDNIIIVAQRVGSIKNADGILVLEDGVCVGQGTHEELAENLRRLSGNFTLIRIKGGRQVDSVALEVYQKIKMLLLLTLICGLLSAVFTMLSPYVLGETIDAVVPGNGSHIHFRNIL